MNLPDIKHLDKIIALCRKRGVQAIKIDNVEITLGEAPAPERKHRAKSTQIDSSPQGEIASDMLSPEDLMFWSVGGAAQDPDTKQES